MYLDAVDISGRHWPTALGKDEQNVAAIVRRRGFGDDRQYFPFCTPQRHRNLGIGGAGVARHKFQFDAGQLRQRRREGLPQSLDSTIVQAPAHGALLT